MKSEAIHEEIEEARTDDQGVHLLDLLIVLSKRRTFIFRFTLGATVLAVIAALIIPNKYTAATLIFAPFLRIPPQAPRCCCRSTWRFCGPRIRSGCQNARYEEPRRYVRFAVYRTWFPWKISVIQRFKLMDRYHVKKQSEARLKFEERSNVVLGVKDGLILISMTDQDPNEAAEIANGYVDEFTASSQPIWRSPEASQRRAFFQP